MHAWGMEAGRVQSERTPVPQHAAADHARTSSLPSARLKALMGAPHSGHVAPRLLPAHVAMQAKLFTHI